MRNPKKMTESMAQPETSTTAKSTGSSKTIFPLGPAALSSSTKAFEWLISPRTVAEFTESFHESQLMHIVRTTEPEYYAGLVTREGAVKKANGSTQIPCAETKFSWLHALCERLENFSHSVWTADVLLLPTSCALESRPEESWSGVFVLQISGPSEVQLSSSETISVSSGSLLYVPQGIASVSSVSGESPGVAVILRFGKNETYADLISLVLPKLLTAAVDQDGDFRKSPPLGWCGRVGKCLPGKKRKREEVEEVKERVQELVSRLIGNFFDVEELADELSAEFIAARLPPAPRKSEKEGKFGPDPRTTPVTAVRWRNPAWVRVVEGKDEEDEDVTLIFGSVENKLSNRSNLASEEPTEPLTLEIPGKMSAPLAGLFESYPQFSGSGALTAAVVAALWDAGLIETQAQKNDDSVVL